MTKSPLNVKKILEEVNKERKIKYNQVLINWYENGLDYVSAHSNKERQLNPDGDIYSISIGATRKFRIRDKSKRKIVKDQRSWARTR